MVWGLTYGFAGENIISFPQTCIVQLMRRLAQPEFYNFCHTKAQYDEVGPSICRRYQIFGSAT